MSKPWEKGFDPSSLFRPQQMQSERLEQWRRENARQQEEIHVSLLRAAEEEDQREQQRIERELKNLELIGALVEQQQAMLQTQGDLLSEQRKQAAEGIVDRRLQYSILICAILAIAAAVGVPVYAETHSLWLLVVVIAADALVSLLAFTLIHRWRRPAAKIDTPSTDALDADGS